MKTMEIKASVTSQAGLMRVLCKGLSPNCQFTFEARQHWRDGSIYRTLVVNEAIRLEAQALLEVAQSQVDLAAAVDARLFAAGQASYLSEQGRAAENALIRATRRVKDLQGLARGQADFGEAGWVDVQDWQDLLEHFGKKVTIGAVREIS